MVDAKALSLWQKKDTVGLFQYLGPMWLKVCMETVWDLIPHGFYPNPDRYQAELAKAGIFVERMELALVAVSGKYARLTTWEDFESANQFRLNKLPQQQRDEVKAFWFAGPTPGLSAPGRVGYEPIPGLTIDLNPSADFTAGFLEGLVMGMDPTNYETVKSKLSANPLEFYGHYVTGVFKGFYEGLKGLIEALVSLFTLALKLSPAGVVYAAIHAAVSETYRKELATDAEKAKAMAQAVLAVMEEFAKHPELYIGKSRSAGKIIGSALAREINEGVASKSAAQMGDFVGEIVGRVLFEVILMIATEGIGTAVRTGAASTEVARIAARVADKMRDALEATPALRRIFVKFLGESSDALRVLGKAPAGAQEIRMSVEEYRAALSHVFPGQSLNEVASLVDGLGQRAAQRAVADPRFLNAYRSGNMTQAGTFFHSAAAQEARSVAQSSLPQGWRLTAERTIQAGKGGSRADIFLEGPGGQIVEFDWKTSGASALTSKTVGQMDRHAGQINVNVSGTLTTQESRSWIDFVRPLIGAPP